MYPSLSSFTPTPPRSGLTDAPGAIGAIRIPFHPTGLPPNGHPPTGGAIVSSCLAPSRPSSSTTPSHVLLFASAKQIGAEDHSHHPFPPRLSTRPFTTSHPLPRTRSHASNSHHSTTRHRRQHPGGPTLPEWPPGILTRKPSMVPSLVRLSS